MTKPKTTASDKAAASDGTSDKATASGTAQDGSVRTGLEPEQMEFETSGTPRQQVETLAEQVKEVAHQLGNEAVRIVEKTSGIPDIVRRDVCKALGAAKKDKLAKMAIALDYLKTVIPEGQPEESGKALGRTTRAVDIRDLMENCEADITDSLDELQNWLVKNVPIFDPIIQDQIKVLDEKLTTFKNRDHMALANLQTEILDRISSSSSGPVIEFGRPTLDWDDQELPQELVKEQGELRAKAEDPRIADLERQLDRAHSQHTAMQAELRDVRKNNKDLQDLVDAYVQKDGGTSTGLFTSTGFPGATGSFKATTPPSTSTFGTSASFGTAKVNFSVPPPKASTFGSPTPHPAGTDTDRLAHALEMLARNQAIPQLPPPEPFSGNAKSDKQSLGDFLEKYERRVANCAESDKVSLLSEYLVGEAKRAYRSVVSTHEGLTFYKLCKELKAMMVDSSRTGRLLRMKRFDDLKIRNGQTYLSFICLIESQVRDSYGDADDQTIDQVKSKVLLNNIRERDLMMHVENALRNAKDDEDQFPVVKALAVAYERTAASASQWQSHGNGPSYGASPYIAPESSECPNSSTNGGNVQAAEGSTPSSSPFTCYYCREPGHKVSECPKKPRGAPRSGGNSVKFGNFKAPKCYACGEIGHMSPACPNKSSSNAASTRKPASNSAPKVSQPVPEVKVESSLEGFANMCVGRTEAEIMQGIIGAPCVAPILVNGCEAKALFDSGSEVNIIGREFLRDVLRKCDRSLRNFPCIRGHPSGLNIRNASGQVMPFAGVVYCELQTDKGDKPELHKFLVQENPNYEVVLGTPALLGNPKWCDRMRDLLVTWNGREKPNHGVNPSSNIYSMRVSEGRPKGRKTAVHGVEKSGRSRKTVHPVARRLCRTQWTAIRSFVELKLSTSGAAIEYQDVDVAKMKTNPARGVPLRGRGGGGHFDQGQRGRGNKLYFNKSISNVD